MNATYLDCPIAENVDKSHVVAVYNPSAVDVNIVRMKVSHGHYEVYTSSDKSQSLTAAVICSLRELDNGTYVNDCELNVKYTIRSLDMKFLFVFYNDSVDLTVQQQALSDTVIQNQNYIINVHSFSEVDGLRFYI